MKYFDTKMFDYDDLTIIGITLALEQQNYVAGSDHWWRIERILEKIRQEQGGKERPLLRIIKDES